MLAVMVVGMFASGAILVWVVGSTSWDEITRCIRPERVRLPSQAGPDLLWVVPLLNAEIRFPLVTGSIIGRELT
jgi:hypothetical protein